MKLLDIPRLTAANKKRVLPETVALASANPQPIPGIPDTLEEFCQQCRIVSGLETLRYDPYGYQRSLYRILEKSSSAWLKTRQLGLTQAALTLLLFEAVRYGYTALWISRAGEDGKEVIKRCRKICYGIPGLRDYLASDNALSMEFWDGSKTHPWGRIVTRAPVSDCGRGLSNVKTIIFDEAQSIDSLDVVYGSALPTSEAVGDAARVLLLGTPPESPQGFYWEMLEKDNPPEVDLKQVCDRVAKREAEPYQEWTDSQGWVKVVCHWGSHPKHCDKTEEEYLGEVRQRTNLPEAQLKREYGLHIPSLDEVSVFAVADVRQCIAESTIEAPEQWGIYATGIDPSGATGGDYTVVCTVRLNPESGLVSVVALWRKRTGAIATHIHAAIEQVQAYPGPTWCEYNGVGSQWPEQLGAGLPGIEVTPHYTSQSKKETLFGRLGIALCELWKLCR